MKSEFVQMPDEPEENMLEAAAAHLPDMPPARARKILRAIYKEFVDMRPDQNYPPDLTKKMIQTLDVIMEYQQEHAYAPTHFELAKLLGIDRTSVRDRLSALKKKGYIVYSSKHRSMKIVKRF